MTIDPIRAAAMNLNHLLSSDEGTDDDHQAILGALDKFLQHMKTQGLISSDIQNVMDKFSFSGNQAHNTETQRVIDLMNTFILAPVIR